VASYDVFAKPSALKELESVGSRKVRRSIAGRIQSLAQKPRPSGCRKLAGGDRYRIRIGRYRVVYSVDDERRAVRVFKVGHRRDIYR